MKRKKFILIACALGLLSGCQSGEGYLEAKPDVPGAPTAPIIIESVAEAGVEPSTDVVTRAAIPVVSGSIGVFLADAASGIYEPLNNVRYTYDSDKSVWASNEGLFFSESDAYVCAYYPYDDTRSDSKKIVLTTQVYDASKDLSFATSQTMNATNNTVSFNMNHAYALLELHLKRDNIKDHITFKQIDMTAAGLTRSVGVNIATGVYETTPTVLPGGKFSMPLSPVLTLPKNTSTIVHKVLIAPTGVLSGGTQFSFTLDDDESTVMSVTISGLTQYDKKKRYVTNLTVNGTEVVAGSVRVLPWTERSLGSEDSPLIPEI